eukprot:2932335-Amphidinium_carterae.1
MRWTVPPSQSSILAGSHRYGEDSFGEISKTQTRGGMRTCDAHDHASCSVDMRLARACELRNIPCEGFLIRIGKG